MQVVGDVDRLDVEQASQMREVRLEGPIRQQILEVAGVRRHVSAPAARQREGVLELGADRQNGLRSRDRQGERLRGVASGAADQALAPVHDPCHRVVVAGPYLSVVREERVGDSRQPLQRLGVVRGQRLVGEVPAGQHDRPAQPLEEQMVQRRVRQEESDAAVQGRGALRLGVDHAVGERRLPVRAPLHQHDRPRRGSKQRLFPSREIGLAPRRLDVPNHHRERLRPAMFAVSQPRHGRGIGRVAGEMVSAQPFDGDDPPGPQIHQRSLQRILAVGRRRRVAGAPVREPRPAVGTGNRLGMETPVRGIAVFGLARRAQREGAHRRPVRSWCSW